jgi:hypothetical protein
MIERTRVCSRQPSKLVSSVVRMRELVSLLRTAIPEKNKHALYLTGIGFKYDTGYPEFVMVFLSLSQKVWGQYFKIGDDHFLPYLF